MGVGGFGHRLGTGGTGGTREPFAVEGLFDQGQSIGGDGGFFLFSRGVAGADVKACEKESYPKHRRARIGGHGAGARGIQQAEQISKEGEGPHGGIAGGGKGVEEDGVWRWVAAAGQMGGGFRQEGGEIAEVQMPIDGLNAVDEVDGIGLQEAF